MAAQSSARSSRTRVCASRLKNFILVVLVVLTGSRVVAYSQVNAAWLCLAQEVLQNPQLPSVEKCLLDRHISWDEKTAIHSLARLLAAGALQTGVWFKGGNWFDQHEPIWMNDPVTSSRFLLVNYLQGRQVENFEYWRNIASSQGVFNEASFLRAKGRPDDALVAAELAYRLDSGWRDQWTRGLNAWTIGKANRQAGQIENAKQAFQVAISSWQMADQANAREYSAYAYRHLGEIAEQQGNRDAALDYYSKSILAAPQYANFSRLSDLMQSQRFSLNDVYSTLATLCQRGPSDDPYLWANSVALFRERKAFDLAQRVLDQVPSKLLSTQVIREETARLAIDRGDWRTAEAVYLSLLAQSPKDSSLVAEYWLSLGRAYQYQGRMQEARSAYEKALALKPDYATAQKALQDLKR